VQRSDLYIFASNNEPGFSLSRRFTAAMPGVLGADLAASDLSHFLSKQRVTPTSVSFIFTRSGEIVAFPDQSSRLAARIEFGGPQFVLWGVGHGNGQPITAAPTAGSRKISALGRLRIASAWRERLRRTFPDVNLEGS
jgi:hypothetical protein